MSDFATIIENASKRIEDEDVEYLFVGIDECFNRAEIEELIFSLLNKGIARSASPLWMEKRICADGTVLHATGGVPRKSRERISSMLGDISKPIKYESSDDRQIVDLLINNFFSYGKIVLLTENIRNNQNGLRRILNEEIQPALSQYNGGKLCLVVLFKIGKTSINDYCSKVVEYLEEKEISLGYTQVFI